MLLFMRILYFFIFFFFFSSRRRHTRLQGDWSSDVCSSDLCERVCAGAGKFEDSQVPTHIVGRDCWTGVGDGIPPQRYALCSTDRAVRREQERTPHHRAVPTLGLRQSEPCHQQGSDSCGDAPTDGG